MHEEGVDKETEPGVTGSNRNRTASETSATGTGAASGEASSTRERVRSLITERVITIFMGIEGIAKPQSDSRQHNGEAMETESSLDPGDLMPWFQELALVMLEMLLGNPWRNIALIRHSLHPSRA